LSAADGARDAGCSRASFITKKKKNE